MLPVLLYTFFYVLTLLLFTFYFAVRKSAPDTFNKADAKASAEGPSWYVYIVTIPLYLWVSFAVGWDAWPVWMLWGGVALGAVWALIRRKMGKSLLSTSYIIFSVIYNTIVVFGLWSFV